MMERAKRQFYIDFVNENSSDQRKLFRATKKLLGCSSESGLYPPHKDLASLTNDFSRFFAKKIIDIRAELDSLIANTCPTVIINEPDVSFKDFEPVTQQYITELIASAPNKSCPNDPVPTQIIKNCVDELAPVITQMVNLSLHNAHFPDCWKEALIRPILKKPKTELVNNNFRPISNLPLLSKLQKSLSHIKPSIT